MRHSCTAVLALADCIAQARDLNFASTELCIELANLGLVCSFDRLNFTRGDRGNRARSGGRSWGEIEEVEETTLGGSGRWELKLGRGGLFVW